MTASETLYRDYLIKAYKLSSELSYTEVLAAVRKIKQDSLPCTTNLTNFDYSSSLSNNEIISEFRNSIEREKKRRAIQWNYVPYSTWKKTDDTEITKQDVIIELMDRIDALGSFKITSDTRSKIGPGQVISRDNLKEIGKVINQNEIMCLCDCNYCTCDCNYCTCDCNYCTCDCNYHASVIGTDKMGIRIDYGDKGKILNGAMQIDDDTSYDKSTNSVNATIWAHSYCTCDCNYCTCDCNYCTCDCNYCTCDCNYCTCDCNYCTCDCNYCTCDCNNSVWYATPKVYTYKPGYYWTSSRHWIGTYVNDGTTNLDGTIYQKGEGTSESQGGSIYCTCDCNYCTCNCNYCTCDCNYCTCDCNYCTCDCNYCTCNCNYRVCWYYSCWYVWY